MATRRTRRFVCPVRSTCKDRTVRAGSPPETGPAIEMAGGGVFGTAGVTLEVIHTPACTAGSVRLYGEDLDGSVYKPCWT